MKPQMPSNVVRVAKVGGVEFYATEDHSYVCWVADLDICNDGRGPAHGDPHHQKRTAYYNGGRYLNADEDRYIVVPPQIRKKCKKVVLGCRARLTNLLTEEYSAAVAGEIGPQKEFGEASYCLAKAINPKISYNSGDKARVYFYEIWPGTPATVGTKKYPLEPA